MNYSIYILILYALCFSPELPAQDYTPITITGFSPETSRAVKSLDSLCGPRAHVVQGKHVGESGILSQSFAAYSRLANVSTEQELICIIENNNNSIALRGYAYMAYAYKCDKAVKKIKRCNYTFRIMIENGCVTRSYSFPEFSQIIRKRNFYNPKISSEDPQENAAIKTENAIRKEQGEAERIK